MFSKSYVISNMHVSYCLQLSGSLSLKNQYLEPQRLQIVRYLPRTLK